MAASAPIDQTPVALRSAPHGEHYTPLPNKGENGYVTAHAVQTILADAPSLFALWADVTTIPLWQERVISVTPLTGNRSHWVMGDTDDSPTDGKSKRIEFDSEITEFLPGQKIAWRSVAGDVEQSGEVHFAPGRIEGSTLVTLIQTVKVPGGVVGNAMASAGQRGPRQTVIEDLRHFKQLAETGEIPSVKDQPHGPRGVTGGFKRWLYGETNPTPPGTSEPTFTSDDSGKSTSKP